MIDFDYKNPDYVSVFKHRVDVLKRIRNNPSCLPALKVHYKNNPADFINDWGMIYEPRNAEIGLPNVIPFVIYQRQRECIEWILENWKKSQNIIIEKTRGVGLSWLIMSLLSTLCLFYDAFSAGIGSRKEALVDQKDDPDSLFWKARFFLKYIPPEFKSNFDSPYMRLVIPSTNSTIVGEAGDGIGRGGRKSMYAVDESAHIMHQKLLDASLSENTNCRIDISTPNGDTNNFAIRRFSGVFPVFTFHWRDDPRRDEAWAKKKQLELDPITYRQEYEIDYSASSESGLIPPEWIEAAIDLHVRLGFDPSGERAGSFDPADEGQDDNAFAVSHGNVLIYIDVWSGKGSDILESVNKCFEICDTFVVNKFNFDADGLGAATRGDARILNKSRKSTIAVSEFRGSGEVTPGMDIEGTKNEDAFLNQKAQSWWRLRDRFKESYRATIGVPFDREKLISIDSKIPQLNQLVSELKQPTYSKNENGKIKIDKKPNGSKSPNMADAVMMRFGSPVIINYGDII